MAFPIEDLRKLATLVADVPIAIFYEFRHPAVALDIDGWRKDDKEDAERIAERVVKAFAAVNMIPTLANWLTRRFYSDDVLATRFVAFCSDQQDVDTNHEAALARRANTLASRPLRMFLAESEPRVCVVVAEHPEGSTQGTGFLIGPDLILTTYHTLEKHFDADGKAIFPPFPLAAFFDHLDGDPIKVVTPCNVGVRKVAFADNWLLPPASALMPGDGTFHLPSAGEILQLQQNLDFVVVRLAERIGSESYAGNGGRRRSWFAFPDPFPEIRPDERIIIPQHPDGSCQQYDFGRFIDACISKTRIRYDTETANGSSGAPCFDSKKRLVGMHNAAFRPHGHNLYNQAIRIDSILPLIAGDLTPPDEKVNARLWSVTPTSQPPRPIVGRSKFIDWLERAEKIGAGPGDGLFTASGVGPQSGRGFSIEILKAARYPSGDPVVEIGTAKVKLVTGLPDVIQSIVDQLPFQCDVAAEIPRRPDPDDVRTPDKLTDWASKEVPKWFSQLLVQNREPPVDARVIARASVALDRARGKLPAPEDLTLSAATEPVWQPQTRWERVWIAVRIVDTLSADVLEFLMGLAGRGKAGAIDGLDRVRLVVVGAVPKDLGAGDASCVEHLEPERIGRDDFVTCIEAMHNNMGLPFEAASAEMLRRLAGAFLMTDEATKPEKRLPCIQDFLSKLVPLIESDARPQAQP